MTNLEEINIWWEGSFSYDEIIKNNIDINKYENKATDIGLYQVYGNHLLYGNDVLLYIGITTEQDFKTRLKNRWIISESNDIKNIKIYLGKIFSSNEIITNKEKDFIFKAEALLINTLKPAFNSSYINSVHHKKINNDNNFIVFNHNSYKNLLPELSTQRWWNNKDVNFEITEKMSKILKRKIIDNDDFYGFDLESNDNICLGVDYSYWDKEKIPLVIGIYKDSIEREILKNKFPNVGEDKEYYFIPACENLKDNKIEEKIENTLLKVENLLQSNSKT